MKPLTKFEKDQHVENLAEFIRKITPIIPFLANQDLVVKQICYIVPFDGEDFYFDYPYNDIAEKFNEDLNTATMPVAIASESALQLFNAFQREHDAHPFVFYRYSLNKSHTRFQIQELVSNINYGKSEKETLMRYLPIVHQGSYLDHSNTHNAMVSSGAKEIGAYYELLTLFWPLMVKNNVVNNTSIACSLQVRPGFKIDAKFEFPDIFYFLNLYFNSPVLTRIINDRRISEILVYQHSFANLSLSDSLFTIKNFSARFDEKEQQEWGVATNKIKAWRFFSDILFKLEQLDNNLPVQNIHPKFLQGLNHFLRYYIEELNYFATTTELISDSDSSLVEMYSTGKRLYDFAIVVWNVLENAWKKSLETGERQVQIHTSFVKRKLSIKVINKGKMPVEIVRYCNLKGHYPNPDPESVKHFRGLQIVRIKCESNDWKLSVNINKSGITELKIKF
jgi:hypothetical protein